MGFIKCLLSTTAARYDLYMYMYLRYCNVKAYIVFDSIHYWCQLGAYEKNLTGREG